MSETTNRMQQQQDAHFMQLALKQAEIAINRGQTPFGAVVVDRSGRLIGEGHNTVRADLDPAAKLIAEFPWVQAQTRSVLEPS